MDHADDRCLDVSFLLALLVFLTFSSIFADSSLSSSSCNFNTASAYRFFVSFSSHCDGSVLKIGQGGTTVYRSELVTKHDRSR